MDTVAARTLLAVPTDMLGYDTEKFFDLVVTHYADGHGPETLDEFVVLACDQEPFLRKAIEAYRDRLKADSIDYYWLDSVRAWLTEANTGATLIDLWAQAQRWVLG